MFFYIDRVDGNWQLKSGDFCFVEKDQIIFIVKTNVLIKNQPGFPLNDYFGHVILYKNNFIYINKAEERYFSKVKNKKG